MSELATPALLAIFLAAALVTWVAGVSLAKATGLLDDRYGLGEALGGMILLSIAGSLQELAITLSAAASGDLGLAAGEPDRRGRDADPGAGDRRPLPGP
jgi:cation:H+ antiporter